MRVLGIGETVIDAISVVHRHSITGEVVSTAETNQDAGGPVPAALALLAGLGAECSLATSIGRDKHGLRLEQIIQKAGIKLHASYQKATKVNPIFVDARTGQRQKSRSNVRHPPLANFDAEFIRSFDLIIMDRHEPEAFHEITRHKRKGTRLILDPSTEVSTFTMHTARHVDCPIIPIEALVAQAGRYSLRQALESFALHCGKPFVVTLGELGSLVWQNKKSQIIQPHNVLAKNTLGAGDIYRGAFAYGMLQKWPLVECASYANTAAALQCTKLGNVSDVPTKKEIEAGLLQKSMPSVVWHHVNAQFEGLRSAYAH
jgi:sugar/nucleoside kinase (ribokinase family)